MLAGEKLRIGRLLLSGAVILLVIGAAALAPDSASAAVCDDFSNQLEAQEAANTRDADGDGIYCEALPCPCSTQTASPGGSGGGGGSTEPPPPPPPPKLSKAAAKRAAWSKARGFAKRNPNVSSLQFDGCTRRSKYRVNCRFFATGKVGNQVTQCNLGVTVRGEGSMASARLRPNCRSLREISAEQALEAMRIEAEKIAGKPAEITNFHRHSRLYFVAQAFWTQPIAGAEECTVSLVAHLLPSDAIRVESRNLKCAPAPRL